ncbi:MAG: hypothetical protein RB292_03025 [Patescibacteria group bacterium]|nr:hypothetical protein [Patescibacteria group bacterium]
MVKFLKQPQNLTPVLFFGLAAIVILWQILLPGYILTLDLIATPHFKVFLEPGVIHNNLLFQYFWQLLNLALPGWLIQKIYLFLTIFLAGFLAWRFLPLPGKSIARLWAGLFYMANPFVYERFLAGQIGILVAYALLPWVVFSASNLFKDQRWRFLVGLFFGLWLLSIFSLHFLAMAIIFILLLAFVHLISLIWSKKFKLFAQLILQLVILGLALALVSSYWLVPAVKNYSNSNLNNFNQVDFQAFVTSSHDPLGAEFNVLSLHGFWGEVKPWAGYFIWPKDHYIFWLAMFGLLCLLSARGVIESYFKNRSLFFLFGLTALGGLVFSLGLAPGIFQSLNQWLFDHIWFWSGFRDTQKWSAWLVLAFAYFGGLGVYAVGEFVQAKKPKQLQIVSVGLMLVVVFFTYPIWGGFSRQLKSIWYPASWQQVAEIIDHQNSDSRILFLPWHQYLSLDFNQSLVSQNPAKAFFGSRIVQSHNAELDGVDSANAEPLVSEIEQILAGDQTLSDINTLRLIKARGVDQILIINSLSLEFLANFSDFKASGAIKEVFGSNDLTLYEILL